MLLHSLAFRELGGMQETMQATAVELFAEPGDLRQLAEAVALHRRLAEELPTVSARLPPLKDMYAALDRYGVSPPTCKGCACSAKEKDEETTVIAWRIHTHVGFRMHIRCLFKLDFPDKLAHVV